SLLLLLLLEQSLDEVAIELRVGVVGSCLQCVAVRREGAAQVAGTREGVAEVVVARGALEVAVGLRSLVVVAALVLRGRAPVGALEEARGLVAPALRECGGSLLIAALPEVGPRRS